MTIKETIEELCQKQKQLDLLKMKDIIENHLIAWPQTADSQLWNCRVEALLEDLEEKFNA